MSRVVSNRKASRGMASMRQAAIGSPANYPVRPTASVSCRRWRSRRHEFLDCISDLSWLDGFRKEGGPALDLAYHQLARDLGLIEFRE